MPRVEPAADAGRQADAAGRALEAEGLTYAYPRQQVLDGVTFSVERGEFVALVGPNGSGKSTLLRLVLGLFPRQAGTVRLFGQPPESLAERWRIGYVPQRPVATDALPTTVEELVACGRLTRCGWRRRLRAEDWEAVETALRMVSLTDLRRRPLTELSVGQQQRAHIAKAFACRPELLVLRGGRIVFDGPPEDLTRTGVSLGVHAHDLPVWLEGSG